MKMLVVGLAMGAVLAASAPEQAARAQAVVPVAKLEQKQFEGLWYEIARLPVKAQRKCVGDAMVLYAEADKAGHFQVVNSCRLAQGYKQIRNGNAKANKQGDGRMTVTYIWPFRHKDWLLAAGDNYEWALVGSPNHKTLWVFSRTASLDPAVLTLIENKAAAQGFDPTKLVMTPQAR